MQWHRRACSPAALPGRYVACVTPTLLHPDRRRAGRPGLHPRTGRVRQPAALPGQAGGTVPRLADLRAYLLHRHPRFRFVAPRTRAFIEILLASLDAQRRPAQGASVGLHVGRRGRGQ